jgi:hypothetical protein
MRRKFVMVRVFKQKFLQTLIYADLSPIRVVLGISELLWAASLLWPGDTFDRGTYQNLQAFIPIEEVWGVIWLITGLTQFYLIYSGKYHTVFSLIFAAFNSILWWFVVVSMYVVFWPPAAAISGELAVAFAAAWVFVRSGWTPLGGKHNAH